LDKIDYNKIVDFFFEVGALKNQSRTGYLHEKVEHKESIASHILRALQIGEVLCYLEEADELTVKNLILYHDNGEARITDLHKLAQKYFSKDQLHKAELEALKDQVKNLPSKLGEKIIKSFLSYENCDSLEAEVARDADTLELLVTVREYELIGHENFSFWFDDAEKYLKTDSAKKLFKNIRVGKFNNWWIDKFK
tara:strand:+ start:2269 stop:2853 length:585 start_codon:yes stop_codon:yes gene_type:complete